MVTLSGEYGVSAKSTIFCGAIQAVLHTDTCPLDPGQCMWQQRATNQCCFTTAELTEQAFAEHVGIAPIGAAEYQALRSRIISEIKESEL